MHRKVLNLARSMMFACALPLQLWDNAVQCAIYILNRSPTRANENRASPIEVLTGEATGLRSLVVFGSSCSVYCDPPKRLIQQRSQKGIIVGVNEETKG